MLISLSRRPGVALPPAALFVPEGAEVGRGIVGAADLMEFVARLEYICWVELLYGLTVTGPEEE